jgi:hypothetical protein
VWRELYIVVLPILIGISVLTFPSSIQITHINYFGAYQEKFCDFGRTMPKIPRLCVKIPIARMRLPRDTPVLYISLCAANLFTG